MIHIIDGDPPPCRLHPLLLACVKWMDQYGENQIVHCHPSDIPVRLCALGIVFREGAVSGPVFSVEIADEYRFAFVVSEEDLQQVA